jgi:hypothetical protein
MLGRRRAAAWVNFSRDILLSFGDQSSARPGHAEEGVGDKNRSPSEPSADDEKLLIEGSGRGR